MSSLYLPVSLLATFGAVFCVWLAVDTWLAERRRAVELLQAQVAETSTNLREQELATRSFEERVLAPAVSGIGSFARRITPVGMRDRIAYKLVLAGSPEGWDAEKVAAFKFAAGLAMGGFALMVCLALGAPGSITLLAMGIVGFIGFLIPGAVLSTRALGRQEEIRRELPDVMDLLTISVEAGLGFDAALAHVRKNIPGPLSQEISRLLQEMQLGVSRMDAFRHLGERTDVEELKGFILSMIQADIFGISIAKVLRSQSRELRIRRRQRAEEKSMKVAVKLLFPLIFCILPAMFVVILTPGVIRIMETLFGIEAG
jgi:tight adherence protein C